MKKIMLYTIATIMLSMTGCSNQGCEPGPVVEDCLCYQVYDPVCGCDGVTYGNDCVATCAGITRFKHGACDD